MQDVSLADGFGRRLSEEINIVKSRLTSVVPEANTNIVYSWYLRSESAPFRKKKQCPS